MGVIYKATSKTSLKSYIGQTKNFEQRKKQHLQSPPLYPFQRALQKYGHQDFEWTILETCPLSKLDEREIYWIAYYDTYHNGYNATQGGDNANSLENWRKTHPKEVIENALNGLKYAQQRNEEHKEEFLAQLAEARKIGIEKCKRPVRCIELDLVFDSLTSAEKWSQSKDNPNGKGTCHQSIGRVCLGKMHTTAGYHWEYVKKDTKNLLKY